MNEEELIASLASSSKSTLSRYRVKNAITPIIYLCGITITPCFVMAYLFRDDAIAKYSLLLVGILAIMTTFGSYLYLLYKHPEKLQSEDYQIRQELLQMVAKQGGKIKILPVDLPTIANPATGTQEEGEKT